MPFYSLQQNIFETQAQAIVIPVNCVGVAGAGLALAAKQRFPHWYEDYRQKCHEMVIDPKKAMTIYKESQPWLINFPTKTHWRKPSSSVLLAYGAEYLYLLLQQEQIRSVALPKLGCGLGGQSWYGNNELASMRSLFVNTLKSLSCDFYLYE